MQEIEDLLQQWLENSQALLENLYFEEGKIFGIVISDLCSSEFAEDVFRLGGVKPISH